MALLLPSGERVTDDNGKPAAAGKIYVYANGTTTLASIFSDPALSVALVNPVELTGGGDQPNSIYVAGDTLYTIRWEESDGTEIRTRNDQFGWSIQNGDSYASTQAAQDATLADGAQFFIQGKGHARYDANSSATANDGTVYAPTSAAGRILLDESVQISVKTFGALGNGANDDTSAIQATINYVIANGGVVYFPAGEYICSNQLVWQDTNTTHTEFTKGGIRGDGSGSSVIRFTGTTTSNTGLNINSGGTEYLTFFYMKDMRIENNIGNQPGYGLYIDQLAYSYFENVYITGCEFGIFATDFLSSTFTNCQIRANKYGGRFEMGGQAAPNALTFNGCNVANTEHGFYILQPSGLVINGGAFEGNGNGGSETDRWGLKIDNGALQGASACLLQGVYFEFNDDTADVWIDQTANAASYTMIGCTFNRIDSSVFVDNNILIGCSSGEANVTTIGCGFKGFNSYVESASRKYVAFNDSGGDIIFNQFGNYYDSTAAAVDYTTINGPGALTPLTGTNYVVTTGTDAYTLADAHTNGTKLFVLCAGHAGDGTITPTSLSGGTTITLGAAGQWAALEWQSSNWYMIAGTATLA